MTKKSLRIRDTSDENSEADSDEELLLNRNLSLKKQNSSSKILDTSSSESESEPEAKTKAKVLPPTKPAAVVAKKAESSSDSGNYNLSHFSLNIRTKCCRRLQFR